MSIRRKVNKEEIATLNSCSYPDRDSRLGGSPMSVLSQNVFLTLDVMTLVIEMAKCSGMAKPLDIVMDISVSM